MTKILFPAGDEIFQDDIAPIHTAELVQLWFDENIDAVKHLRWPARSPDFNLIRMLLSILELSIETIFTSGIPTRTFKISQYRMVDETTFTAKDAFLLIYSVTQPKSLSFALQKLEALRRLETKCQYIYPNLGPKVYILVANKIDLVRCRAISPDDNLVALQFKYDQARRRFVEWAQNEIAVVPNFHKRILFSDEAHFWLNGYVNKQNCRIWSEANPQVYVETLLHPEKLTVWCALWAGGIIDPYFFKNDEGHNVTVNGDRYRAMITNFFIPELNNHDVQELGFQQDGATCHTARATIDLLKDTFGDRLISHFGPVNWPPRSCDLTPLDYFLWGYVKSLVYADKPQTLDHLEDNIRRVIADIRPQMLEKVIENWTSRLDYIRANRGSLMPEIIFKM
ncbi:histone-lysine N-methyltransferase SETMAR [Trichonephila clavipes]|nr:histone-lysine N-methyltransferase SETMAR [Trichonephila clavipes]